jgi:myosin-5
MSASSDYRHDIWEELSDKQVEDFRYLTPCSTDKIDGVSDADQWPRTLNALRVFQFDGETLRTLLQALCIVLQLGNLTFDNDPAADHEEGGTVISSVDELTKLSKLMGIPGEVLESCMTMRLIKTGYDEVYVQLSPSVAKEACDALAKEIYAKIFDVLVQKINEYTRAETHMKHQYGLISLLDIFGFERFKVNRFEQMCINYANEQLQHKYVLDNFRQVQQEYEAEGIEIFDFKVVDNSDVLNLLEGRLGIIISLNEECVRPKGNDESYVYKIKIVHKEHNCLVDEKLHRRTEFGVKHFAGPVTYDSTKFVERNTDKLPDGLMHCAAKSTNQVIRQEFKQLIAAEEETASATGARQKKKHRTVLEKFRVQLKSLMASMEGTTTRYIRCIKPNETMTPKMTDHYHTMRQLECAGLVTAIAISRESFPNRLGYDAIRTRFDCLMNKRDLRNVQDMSKRDTVNYMLSNMLPSVADLYGGANLTLPFACGKTRIYFRAGALEHLETMRLDYYTNHTVVIQRWIRKIQARDRFLRLKDTAVRMQALARRRIESHCYRGQQAAALSLQCWCRGKKAKETMKDLRCSRSVIKIQSRQVLSLCLLTFLLHHILTFVCFHLNQISSQS